VRLACKCNEHISQGRLAHFDVFYDRSRPKNGFKD
jgi:hypothetical protein